MLLKLNIKHLANTHKKFNNSIFSKCTCINFFFKVVGFIYFVELDITNVHCLKLKDLKLNKTELKFAFPALCAPVA